jgi:hypothetical protein
MARLPRAQLADAVRLTLLPWRLWKGCRLGIGTASNRPLAVLGENRNHDCLCLEPNTK